YTLSEVIWAARHEMARTIEDVLARRMRLLFLDAKEAASAAKITAEVLGKELGKSAEWKQQQVSDFVKLTKKYTLHSPYGKLYTDFRSRYYKRESHIV